MYLCRFSVRYASSTNSVFKPINFKHKPRIDEITEPPSSNRNKKYDGRSRQSSRDDRAHHPSVKERDKEGLAVIRSPMDASRRSEDRNRGFGDDRRRRQSRDQCYDSDREEGGRHFTSRRRNNDDGSGFRNRGNHEDYPVPSKNNQGEFRGRQFTGYRPSRYDSSYNNDEFRQSNSNYRQRNGENKHDDSDERNLRQHHKTSYNNSRRRPDTSDYGSNEHANRDYDKKLVMLSSDSSLGDVENVFGIHPVLLALQAGKRTIHKIFCKQGNEKMNPKIKEIYKLATDKNIEFVSVHGSEIKKIFKGDTVHQGIFCLASPLPVSVFNVDSCQELTFTSVDFVTLEGSSKTRNDKTCLEQNQRNPPDYPFNYSNPNSNNISRYACDASPSSYSNTLSDREKQGSDTFSAQHSSNSTLNDEPTESNQSSLSSETTPSSTRCAVPPPRDATQPSSQPTVFPSRISSPASLSSVALSSAVAIAAMQPEQNLSSSADHLTAAPLSEAGLERYGSSDIEVPSSSEVWQQSEAQSKPQLWLLLDSVSDGMNVGAVLRSCCYFGVDRVLFTPSCAEISPVVSKASSGAAELLPLSLVPQPGPTLAALRGRGWTVLVAVSRGAESPHRPRPLHEYAMTGNTLLVVGNEGSGVSASISEQADAAVIIPANGPLAGALGCLNVSVAAAITLHALTSRIRLSDDDVSMK